MLTGCHFVIASVSCHCERSAAISPLSVIASATILSSRGTKRSRLSRAGKQGKARCFAGSPLSVIARNVAISVVQGWRTIKREIASQARNDINIMSSRGTKRSRLSSFPVKAPYGYHEEQFCHCERSVAECCHCERSAAISPVGAPSVIARDEAISIFHGWPNQKREIASQARNDSNIMSSRGTKRSRLSGAGEQSKARLPRCARNDKCSCHREERGDLGSPGLVEPEKRDCRAALAMTDLTQARNTHRVL